jgi:predicted dehydrogenase/nucleoside-diphosphate-sugar epimerase
MIDTKLKVALIGCGKMGLHHAKAIEMQQNAKLVAVADPAVDVTKLESIVGDKVAVFDSAQEMLKAVSPDVVHIVTPHNTHVDLAKLALEHDAHIYVEKPFALTAKDAKDIIALANKKDLKVCAAHQVLFQDSGRKYREYIPLIGDIAHVESYFSFKTVRRAGSGLMSPVEQLEDILPHPVYLLLSALETVDSNSEANSYELCSFEVDPAGEVRAIIKQGDALALLIVTLRGRPIESYLRIAGTNGSINADFVLSGVTRILGPGASAIAAVLQPFSEARQKVFGTLTTIFKMVFKRQKSYSGLAELIEAYYKSITQGTALPMTYDSIVQTVEICEQIGFRLREAEIITEKKADGELVKAESALVPTNPDHGVVLITGGTGFLGRELVKELRNRAWPVRVIARNIPSAANRVPGIEYVLGDVSNDIPDEYFENVISIIHLAAETVGGKEEHERNTVGATKKVIEGAIRNKIQKFINISSIAVHKPSSVVGGAIKEDSPVDMNNLGRGPYVWAKAEAEKIVIDLCDKNNIAHKTIRLGPLVNFQQFTPPGRLGREVGTLYVAMGSSRNELSVCDVHTAAEVIRFYIENFEEAPGTLNLVESPAPKRKELVEMLRKKRPELRVMWIPVPILKTLSIMLKGALRIKKPSKKPLDLYAAFASEKYDTKLAGDMITKARMH